MSAGAERSVRSVRERLDALPGALEQALEASQRADAALTAGLPAPIVACGVGASSGPARALVASLSQLGVSARFAPLSTFYAASGADPGEDPEGERRGAAAQPPGARGTLVVFSQRLSPNARLALAARGRFERTVLCTTVDDETLDALRLRDARTLVRRLPDVREPPTLLRLLGPACATLDALRLARSIGAAAGAPRDDRLDDAAIGAAIEALPRASQRAAAATERLAADPRLERRAALLTTCGYDAWCAGLAWVWQEGLLTAAPPLWDALALAHGPLQQMYDEPALLLALTQRDSAAQRALLTRVRRVLAADRHDLVSLEAESAAPLSVIEHGAQLGWLMLAALQARPRDLFDWPGKGADDALYQLGSPSVGTSPESETTSEIPVPSSQP